MYRTSELNKANAVAARPAPADAVVTCWDGVSLDASNVFCVIWLASCAFENYECFVRIRRDT
jgi:hypothetical protein